MKLDKTPLKLLKDAENIRPSAIYCPFRDGIPQIRLEQLKGFSVVHLKGMIHRLDHSIEILLGQARITRAERKPWFTIFHRNLV